MAIEGSNHTTAKHSVDGEFEEVPSAAVSVSSASLLRSTIAIAKRALRA
jgi:hypothetical protein